MAAGSGLGTRLLYNCDDFEFGGRHIYFCHDRILITAGTRHMQVKNLVIF